MVTNPLKKPLRRILRRVLASLSRWALKKHKPEIVAIVGEGKTGIAREAIYRVVKSKYPVRRNIEAPDAELVLPLIILGAKEYPKSYWGWLKVLFKSAGLLLFRPAHKHYLVLEIAYSHKEIFDYFWELTRPPILVICGDAPYLSESQKPRYVINVEETDGLEPYLRAAVRVGKLLEIKEEKAKEALANFSLPTARIRVLPSKEGGTIIDATYQYYPLPEESLEEILEAFPGKKLFFTPDTLKRAEKARIGKGEVGIVVGPKKTMWPILLELTKTPWVD